MNKLQKKLKIKNPGLLSIFISQNILRSSLVNSALEDSTQYDYMIMTRPDINIKNLKFPQNFNDNVLYTLKTTPFNGENGL